MLYVPPGASVIGDFGQQTISSGTSPPTVTTFGVSVTSGSGAYGTYTQLFSAISQPAYGICLYISYGFQASRSAQVMNIGIDLAGGSSYTTYIPNIMISQAGAVAGGSGMHFYFPMYFPAGCSIGVATAGSLSQATRVAATLMQQPADPSSIRTASYAESIGVTTVSGVVVVPGASNAEGSWTSIGTTVNRNWWWQIGYQLINATWQANTFLIDLAVGDGTTFDIIQSNMAGTHNASNNSWSTHGYYAFGVERDIPAGSTLYARIQGGNASPTNFEVSIVACGGG